MNTRRRIPSQRITMITLITITLIISTIRLQTLRRMTRSIQNTRIQIMRRLTRHNRRSMMNTNLSTSTRRRMNSRTTRRQIRSRLNQVLMRKNRCLSTLQHIIRLIRRPPRHIINITHTVPPMNSRNISRMNNRTNRR